MFRIVLAEIERREKNKKFFKERTFILCTILCKIMSSDSNELLSKINFRSLEKKKFRILCLFILYKNAA